MVANLAEELVSVERAIPMRRVFAHASRNTFSIPPIREVVRRYLNTSRVSVDPFARSKRWATYTNDLNPDTAAEFHMDAEEFLKTVVDRGVLADLVLFDPPYSPRQISDCYKGIGRVVTMQDTQNSVLYARVKRQIDRVLAPSGIVISCGWNSTGMQNYAAYVVVEILIVCHGAGRNDTIVTVERKVESTQGGLFTIQATKTSAASNNKRRGIL